MDKRKYLIYISLGFYLIFSSLKIQANSAWLPEQGQYKIAFSNSKIDRTSKEVKNERVEKFLDIEEKVNHVINKLMSLTAELEILKKSLDAYNIEYQLSLTKKEGYIRQQLLEQKIKFQNNKMEVYKAILCLLNPYQQEEVNSTYIEYAPKDNMSFGIDSYIKENVFTDSKYTSSKYKSNTKSAGLFYKYKIFQNKNLVFSLQPKVIFHKNSNFKSEEIFHEISFLTGATKKIYSVEFFTQGAVTYGAGTSDFSKKKRHRSYEYSEGIKLPYSISVIKFTKYYQRKNHGPSYIRNIYEQFSIAKKFKFGNLRPKNLTIQLGYFWDYNLKRPRHEVSGTLISIWSEI